MLPQFEGNILALKSAKIDLIRGRSKGSVPSGTLLLLVVLVLGGLTAISVRVTRVGGGPARCPRKLRELAPQGPRCTEQFACQSTHIVYSDLRNVTTYD